MTTKRYQSRDEKKVLFLTILIAISGLLGVDIHLASLPTMMQLMHTDKEHMHQSISIYLLGMGGSMLFYGPLSDKYGRKPIILFGLIFSALACFASIFTHSIDMFLFMRLLQGIGAGVCIGLDRTMMGDVWDGDQLAIAASKFSLVVALSPIFGPALGGYLQQYFDWQATFIVLGSFLALTALLFAIFCPETNGHESDKPLNLKTIFAEYRDILGSKTFVLCLLLGGMGASIEMVYASLSPFIFQGQFHLDPVFYGWIAGILGVGAFAGRSIAALMIKQFGRINQMKVCASLFLLVSILFLIFKFSALVGVVLLIVVMLFVTLAETGMNPIFSTYALHRFPTEKGAGGSLFGSGQMLISFAITAIAGGFSQGGLLVLVITYGVMAVVMFFLVMMLTRRIIQNGSK